MYYLGNCAIPRSVYRYCVSKCAFCSVHVNPAPVFPPSQSHYCTASKPALSESSQLVGTAVMISGVN